MYSTFAIDSEYRNISNRTVQRLICTTYKGLLHSKMPTRSLEQRPFEQRNAASFNCGSHSRKETEMFDELNLDHGHEQNFPTSSEICSKPIELTNRSWDIKGDSFSRFTRCHTEDT